ncbi:flagellar hook-length control protein FliK [Pseudoalteromonas ulvae]|uniref:Flagellar hook-length control protein-like C-terminal domain-containing protein n=1 Tax=Pseudoalteromonas ulvae TaxID=107327 RepID=A0A244CSI0_PSEDV|nr:flagellar hook-length control protein FliK [Pseudoalteromonas ulvae]OUL58538.1 hypothetical protein B1199_09455 [Pseudoalteromonas ulvae]
MQNISEIFLTNTQQLKLSADQPNSTQQLAPNQSYPIKNARSDGLILKAEIQINGAWQAVSLPLSAEQKQSKFLIQAGTLTFNSEHIITLKEQLSVAIKLQPNELLSLLKLFTPATNTQLSTNSTLLPVKVNTSLNELFFPTLKAALPTNSSIATMLAKADSLVAHMDFKHGQIRANISAPPQQAIIHSQAFSAEKLLNFLSKGLSTAEMRIPTTQHLELKVASNKVYFPMIQSNKIEPTWQSISHISKNKNELHISAEKAPISLSISLATKSPTSSDGFDTPLTKFANEQTKETNKSTTLPLANQTEKTTTPILTTLWHKLSRSVQPATASPLKAQLPQSLPITSAQPSQHHDMNEVKTGQTPAKAVNSQFFAPYQPMQKTSSFTSDKITNANDISSVKVHVQTTNELHNAVNSQKASDVNPLANNQKPQDKLDLNQLGKVIHRLSEQGLPEAKELNKLIHQAFSKLISADTISPTKVRTEVTQILQPKKIPAAFAPTTFSNAISQLSTELLTLELAQQHNQQLTINNKLEGILQLLFPKNKFDLNALLSQSTSSPLLQDLGQIQSALQVNQAQITSSPDLPSIFQFLLPMKLAPEAHQTEIKIGHYEKKNKTQASGKKVWFVRLNFDLGELGKLQTHAQIMDKSVSFDIVASSAQLTAKTEPHIHSLKKRLNEHGLHIEHVTLKHAEESNMAFFDQHSIINIKV